MLLRVSMKPLFFNMPKARINSGRSVGLCKPQARFLFFSAILFTSSFKLAGGGM